MEPYLYDILNVYNLKYSSSKTYTFFTLKNVSGSLFSKQSLGRRKPYYHPRMILLVKRKQIPWEGGALHLRGNEVFRKLVDRGHIFKSVTLEPPQNSVLLSWEEVLQWGSYSRSQDNARHWCLNIKSKGWASVHSGFHVPVMWPWLEQRVAFKGRRKNLSFFYINSSVAASVNWIEEFQIRRLPVSL